MIIYLKICNTSYIQETVEVGSLQGEGGREAGSWMGREWCFSEYSFCVVLESGECITYSKSKLIGTTVKLKRNRNE